MRKDCAACGEPFEAANARRRTCSDRCRKAASRSARIRPVRDVPPKPDEPKPVDPAGRGELWQVTHAQLVAADRVNTPLGQLALQHAAALDSPDRTDTGSSLAALSKEYRAALAEAIRDAETERDDLDDILESANVKRISGGAS